MKYKALENNDEDIFDVFRIIANNRILRQIDHNNLQYGAEDISMLIQVNPVTIFQAITSQSFYYRTLSVKVNSIKTPNITLKVVLTNEKPWHVFPFPYELNLIQLSPELLKQNAGFEIYTSRWGDYDTIAFFEDENFTKKIDLKECAMSSDGTLGLYYYNCKVFTSQLYILTYYELAVLFIQSTVRNGCIFENNVLKLSPFEDASISNLSTNDTICLHFIIVPYNEYFILKKIWTSSLIKSFLKIYSGEEKKLILNVDTQSINHWHDIQLNSLFYVIEVPKQSAFLINIIYSNSIIISTFPYYSLATSVLYGINDIELCQTDFILKDNIKYHIKNYDVKITLLYYNVTQPYDVCLTVNRKKRIMNSTFDTQILSKTNFQISLCNRKKDILCGDIFGFIASIETLDHNSSVGNNETTTSREPLRLSSTTIGSTTNTAISDNLFTYFHLIFVIIKYTY